MPVARQQTLVQLNDSLLALADERAARAGISRSELIRAALEAYLAGDREAAIDAAIADGYAQIPAEQDDAWAQAAGRRSIATEP